MYKVMICNAVPRNRNAGTLLPGTAVFSLRNIQFKLCDVLLFVSIGDIRGKREYSVLRVPLIRDRIPSVAQSVPLTY